MRTFLVLTAAVGLCTGCLAAPLALLPAANAVDEMRKPPPEPNAQRYDSLALNTPDEWVCDADASCTRCIPRHTSTVSVTPFGFHAKRQGPETLTVTPAETLHFCQGRKVLWVEAHAGGTK